MRHINWITKLKIYKNTKYKMHVLFWSRNKSTKYYLINNNIPYDPQYGDDLIFYLYKIIHQVCRISQRSQWESSVWVISIIYDC